MLMEPIKAINPGLVYVALRLTSSEGCAAWATIQHGKNSFQETTAAVLLTVEAPQRISIILQWS